MKDLTFDEILYTIDAINDRLNHIQQNGEDNKGEKEKLESASLKLAFLKGTLEN